MNFLDLYYIIKPLIPRRVQFALRRQMVLRQREQYRDVWPIDERAGKAPEGWPGWPEGKKFALVLTHDVETAAGQEKVLALARLEQKLGFRSCFNFVGQDYPVYEQIRTVLTEMGFEVGVHGLTHKGNLFRSWKVFEKQRDRINKILTDWKALGFRSPSMYRNLEWIGQLDIEYDMSSFDTDPFEPQPQGMGTIFPFWVDGISNGNGYVELPYTLPQDHILFTLLQEKDLNIWQKKLEWLARKGGMALLLVHPDYMAFNSWENATGKYPVSLYEDFLRYIKENFDGDYWHCLPRDVTQYTKQIRSSNPVFEKAASYLNNLTEFNKLSPPNELHEFRQPKKLCKPNKDQTDQTYHGVDFVVSRKKKIWIDLDNSPHVPFFFPIINELKNRNHEVLLTARDCSQTCGLADLFEMRYKRIGRHYGKNQIFKVGGTVLRSLQLLSKIKSEKPDLAVSHGSRAQMLSAKLLKMPSIAIMDYEHVKGFISPSWIMMPEVISGNSLQFPEDRILKYPGIKEDVYVPNFKPDSNILSDLGVNSTDLLVTIRPPATEAHYHNPEAEALFLEAVNYLGSRDDVKMVILPRYDGQKVSITGQWPEWCSGGKIIIPEKVVDGLNLLWHSDFAISGGGTMNREAAALRIPVYSIFRGKIGAVDQYLVKTGRLVLLESIEDVREKLSVVKRILPSGLPETNIQTLNAVVEGIVKALNTATKDSSR